MTKKYFFIFTFLCGMFLTDGLAQSAAMKKADSLFNAGEWFRSSIEYERAVYYEPAREVMNEARLRKALSYRHLNRYKDALSELDRIPLFSISDTLIAKVLYEKAFNLLLLNKHEEALWNIRRIEKSRTGNLPGKMVPLEIIILNNTRKYKQAQSIFLSWADHVMRDSVKARQWKDSIHQLYSKENLPKNYSEEKARNLSRFIPGAGHVYAGHPWEGAASFVLNGAAIGFGIHQLWYKYYFTAYLAGFGVFYKSYFGGMNRAAHLAEIARHNEMEAFNDRCAELIMKIL